MTTVYDAIHNIDWTSGSIVLIFFLFCYVNCRAHATYGLGRLVVGGAFKGRKKTKLLEKIAEFFEGPLPKRGAELLNNWGGIILPLCFFTTGIQSAILAGAGILRMKWVRFALWVLPGTIVWSLLYGFGLLAVWLTITKAIAGSIWAWIVVAVVVVGLVAWCVSRNKKLARQETARAKTPSGSSSDN